jgi:hypothetical protein
MVLIKLTVDEPTYDALWRIHATERRPLAEIVREAIREYLAAKSRED